MFFYKVLFLTTCFFMNGCGKKERRGTFLLPNPAPASFDFSSLLVDNKFDGFIYYDVSRQPVIKISFNAAINKASVPGAVNMTGKNGASESLIFSYENADSTLIIQPASFLAYLSNYQLSVGAALLSQQGSHLRSSIQLRLNTCMDSSRKFPLITDDSLLTLVQKQTFRYFWDFAHPVSGMARERNSSGDVVTTGGTGFGIMAILVAIERGFISRTEGRERIEKIVDFLENKAQRFHGIFSHWLNGSTGQTIPFSTKDDGADLVETSFLFQGLLSARQYFNVDNPTEMALRNNINALWNRAEWNWFTQNNQNVLYWHWSPNYQWQMNMPVKGWNEALITYVLAASSATYPITKTVYDIGWAGNGAMVTNNSYFGYLLPLGSAYGGPLFFSHYSFLGIDPNGLTDAYAHYEVQTRNHALVNYTYCRKNIRNYFGYSDSCWGITASDIPGGYAANSPANDIGVIAPTAALSSFPYTPKESMQALKFFYYVLGDKLFKSYGFVDAFSLQAQWFADSYLAIDQGPIIVMIENYRTRLLWKLFTSCPEVKAGLLKLGFSAPYL